MKSGEELDDLWQHRARTWRSGQACAPPGRGALSESSASERSQPSSRGMQRTSLMAPISSGAPSPLPKVDLHHQQVASPKEAAAALRGKCQSE